MMKKKKLRNKFKTLRQFNELIKGKVFNESLSLVHLPNSLSTR